jgi:structural maintenance of chromosome 2
MGQLADSRARLAQAAAEEEQNKVKLAMAEKELAALQVRWRDVEREAGEGRKKIEKARAEVDAVRKKLDGCGWSEAQEKEMEQEVKKAKDDLKRLTEVR